MKTTFIENEQSLTKVINTFQLDENIHSGLLLLSDPSIFDNNILQNSLKKTPKKVIGGVFPEIIYEGNRKNKGAIFIPFPSEMKTSLVDLSTNEDAIFEQLEEDFGQLEDTSGSIFVIYDALGEQKTSLLEALFNYFGTAMNFIGGGAGSLSFQSMPCVLNERTLSHNVAVIGFLPTQISMGVAHGWSAITEPMKVTEAEGTRVKSINWKPAFEVYREIVEEHSGLKFNEDNFFDIAKSYPLGITKIDAEPIIRDPFVVEENEMLIVDEVGEGEFISIMNGNRESLLKGAKKARDIATQSAIEEQSNLFCIDCISRVLYMKEGFQEEIDIIQSDSKVNGILTIGEVANIGESMLEIFNKTVVIAKW